MAETTRADVLDYLANRKLADFWDGDIRLGKMGEEVIINTFPGQLAKLPDENDKEGDIVLTSAIGPYPAGTKLEVKTDCLAHDTGNVFVERWCNWATQKDGGPWQAQAHGCALFMYWLPQADRCYLFEPDRLIRLARWYQVLGCYVPVGSRADKTMGLKVYEPTMGLWADGCDFARAGDSRVLLRAVNGLKSARFFDSIFGRETPPMYLAWREDRPAT